MTTPSRFHSVYLQEAKCSGCTTCVTSCPVEAIRVRNGRAVILEERCIDCGECIRLCPNHAKKALSAELEQIKNYNETTILVSPSFYAQFPQKFTIRQIQSAILSLGFTRLFDVSNFAYQVSCATAQYLKNAPDSAKPVISTSCPAIIKLIQIRFPSLIENLLPVLPPVEIAARKARSVSTNENHGIFFISPCPAKITVPRYPPGYESSAITAVFSTADLYLPVLNALKKGESEEDFSERINPGCPHQGYRWAMSDGEIDSLKQYAGKDEKINWLSCDGISHSLQTLEAMEEDLLESVDFIEMSVCQGGCIGGPLVIKPVPIAHAAMRNRLAKIDSQTENTVCEQNDFKDIFWTKDILPRPSLVLDPDFSKARKMMEKIVTITGELPGLNCGSCGSPNCRALAEDIVRKQARKEDCIQILKKEYEKLVLGK